MRKHTPADIDAALTRLAGQVDRLEHDLTTLTTGQTRLAGDVLIHTRTLSDLAQTIRTGTPGAPSPATGAPADNENDAPAPEWLTMTDPALAVAFLGELDVWTRTVWNHYTPLTLCWPWHPTVVAELLCCQHLWTAALDTAQENGAADAFAAWHERWRPGAAHRIHRTLTACERADGAHVTPTGIRHTVDPTVLDEVAHWWATTHGTTPAPGLTPDR